MNGMNVVYKDDAEEDNFGVKAGSMVSAFDAFPKSKPQYVQQTSGGGKWTVVIFLVSLWLAWSETARWWRGTEMHTFAVEKGIGHSMQINTDFVVRMRCQDLHVNVQDASGDRILAASMLRQEPTNWSQWVDGKGVHKLGRDSKGKIVTGEGWMDEEGFGEEHVHDIVASAWTKKGKFSKTPRLWGGQGDSCRIFGSLELNKVQGDFHITAKGHGYNPYGEHLDHKTFNFSHILNELSFGPFYPTLVNPLDRTINIASANFHRFQYFTSIVPTVYSLGRDSFSSSSSLSSPPSWVQKNTIFTNQYAVTEQSKEISDHEVPGIFIKYDIEPILLTIEETRPGYLAFALKLVNIVSGVLVAGHWGFKLSDWAKEVAGRRRRRTGNSTEGVLGVMMMSGKEQLD